MICGLKKGSGLCGMEEESFANLNQMIINNRNKVVQYRTFMLFDSIVLHAWVGLTMVVLDTKILLDW